MYLSILGILIIIENLHRYNVKDIHKTEDGLKNYDRKKLI